MLAIVFETRDKQNVKRGVLKALAGVDECRPQISAYAGERLDDVLTRWRKANKVGLQYETLQVLSMVEMRRSNEQPPTINDNPSARTISMCTVSREHVRNKRHQEIVWSGVIEIRRHLQWTQPMATANKVVPRKLETVKEWRHESWANDSDQATASGRRR